MFQVKNSTYEGVIALMMIIMMMMIVLIGCPMIGTGVSEEWLQKKPHKTQLEKKVLKKMIHERTYKPPITPVSSPNTCSSQWKLTFKIEFVTM